MPNISDILDKNKDKGKFTKKEYRPWNLGQTMSTQEDIKEKKSDSSSKVALVEQSISEPINQISEVPVQIASKKIVEKEVTKIREEANINFTDRGAINLSAEDYMLKLTGRQKDLLIFIIRNIINSKSLITLPIYSKDLVANFSTTLGTIKSAARRLEAKGLIKSVSQRARGGHFRFEVKEEIVSIAQRLFFKI